MRHVRLHQAAAEEAVEAAAWYELQQSGLGREFDAAIQAASDLLEQDMAPLTPLPGTPGARGAMRLVLRRFPYDIVVFDHQGEMLVLAIAHHSRRPGYWRDRRRA